MSHPRVIISVADARKLAAPLLEIAPGDKVTPVREWRQDSARSPYPAELRFGACYIVARVEGGYSGAFVTLEDQPGERFPAHLFAKAN